MKIHAEIEGESFWVDLAGGRSIAINLDFSGPQPNHFGVERASTRTVEVGTFVGDTLRGGSCNVEQLTLIPHCNGTHTESVGHIVNDDVPVGTRALEGWYLAGLCSVPLLPARETAESYRPELDHHDMLVTRSALQAACADRSMSGVSAIVLRTLPNAADKRSRAWGNPENPAFLTVDAMQWIVERGFEHLLLDLPSVDKMYDEGLLTNHHIFWNVAEGSHQLSESVHSHKTISEMVFVADDILDGTYLLNLQFAAMGSDAAPSRPVLYPLIRA
jgi:kynurenine formamidase